MTIYEQWEMTSDLLHTATHFKLIISSSFQSQSNLFGLSERKYVN